MLQQAYQVVTNVWKFMIKIAAQATILLQATEEDLAQFERFQQDALGSIGLKVGLPPIQKDWACPSCQKRFKNKQVMRMHEVAKHKIMHIAHAYMPATSCQCCMWEYDD